MMDSLAWRRWTGLVEECVPHGIRAAAAASSKLETRDDDAPDQSKPERGETHEDAKTQSSTSSHGDLFPALWCLVARFNDQSDCASLLQCRSRLLGTLDAQALWHHHAFASGIASLASGNDASWVYPFMPGVQVDKAIDWRHLLQVNRQAAGALVVQVRVRNIDLHVPLLRESSTKDGFDVPRLLELMRRLVHMEWATSRSVTEAQGWPLRLRQLQWGGRPGLRVEEDELCGGQGGSVGLTQGAGGPVIGGRLLLEWALPCGRWPLPSQRCSTSSSVGAANAQTLPGQPTPQELQQGPFDFRRRCCAVSLQPPSFLPEIPFLGTRLRSSSDVSNGSGRQPSRESHAERPSERCALLHLDSSLVPPDVWIAVDIGGTVESLRREIGQALAVWHSHLDGNLVVRLVDPNQQLARGRCPHSGQFFWGFTDLAEPSTPLRQLGWSQSESVRVEPVHHFAARWRPTNRDIRRPLLAGTETAFAPVVAAGASEASLDGSIVVLVVREQSFVDQQAPRYILPAPAAQLRRRAAWLMEDLATGVRGLSKDSARSNGRDSEDIFDDLDGVDIGRSRQVTSPPKLHSADMSDQLDDPPQLSSWGRSFTEPAPTVDWQRRPADAPAEQPVVEATEQATEQARGAAPGAELSPAQPSPADVQDRPVAARSSWTEPLVPHYPPTLLPRTVHARQFEFHSSMQDLVLVGDKLGNVNVYDLENDMPHPPLAIDTFAVLGLAWMQKHPQSAVCGAAGSGRIAFLRFDPNARPTEPVLRSVSTFEEFPKLTSLSTNCTDDFLVATGMSRSLIVYDVSTGKVLHRDHYIHDHFVNTGRFCSSSPHIFCTASFDHTCKIWDLRQPLGRDRAARTLNTGGQNVMCVFSPDDRHLLCSGVDTRLVQYEIPSWHRTPETFELREPLHPGRYRRSMYLADSPHIVTAATEESHLHVLSVKSGSSLGVVDFRGIVKRWLEGNAASNPGLAPAAAVPESSGISSSAGTSSLLQCSYQALWSRRRPTTRSRLRDADSNAGSLQGIRARGEVRSAASASLEVGSTHPTSAVVRGELTIEDGGGGVATNRQSIFESVQSIRTHPIIKNRVGVLLCLPQAEQTSCIALMHLDPCSIGWEE